MFQTIMNKILQDLINTGKVVSFINDVIIEMEIEEEHDEIVEEVVRKLAQNDLYVKPEKCKWKVKEVGFLGVVIGLERIKMEEEKMKDILDSQTSQLQKELKMYRSFWNQ